MNAQATTIVAVVPTYRPDADDLLTVVNSLLASGTCVVVTDDASPCTADPALRACGQAGAIVIRHRRNEGIARGLNEGLAHARLAGAFWLLTMDQDSTIPDGYITRLLAATDAAERVLGRNTVGVIGAGGLDDASGDVGYPVTDVDGVATTEEVFQSGSLWSVRALDEVGGFDESLGIDGVDAAACLHMRETGMHVVVAPDARIGHRYGSGRQITLLGRTVVSTGHSPARRESMVRNRLRLLPAEFAQSPRHAFRTIRRVGVNTVLGMTIEEDRWENTKGSARGLLPRRSSGN